jgi:hypothetical protein
MSQPDEQAITRAAEAAINDLLLNCRVEKVFEHPKHKDKWCIRFTNDYGQFCDEFRNESGQENSPRLIREKVKNYFLKMRKPVRVRRGSKKTTADKGKLESLLPAAPLEIVGQALDQTTRLVGEVINQVSGLARSALDTEASVSVELPAIVLPPPRRKRVRQTATKKPTKRSSGKSTRKDSSRSGKSTSKTRKAAKKGGGKKQSATARTKRSGKKRV